MDANIILVSSLTFIVFVVVILGIYYIFSRKNMKRQQQYFEKLHAELQVGKRVVCANGLYGTVKKVDEEKVDVEIAKGVVITVSRFAISEVLSLIHI